MLDLTTYKYEFSRYSIQTLESIFRRHFGYNLSDEMQSTGISYWYENGDLTIVSHRELYRTEILFRLNNALESQIVANMTPSQFMDYAAIGNSKMINRLRMGIYSLLSDEKLITAHNDNSDHQITDIEIARDRMHHAAIHNAMPKGRPQSLSDYQFEYAMKFWLSGMGINALARIFVNDPEDKKAINSVYNSLNQYILAHVDSEFIDNSGKRPKLIKRNDEIKKYNDDMQIWRKFFANEFVEAIAFNESPDIDVLMDSTANDIILEHTNNAKYQTRLESRERARKLHTEGFNIKCEMKPITATQDIDYLFNQCKPINAAMKPVGCINMTNIMLRVS